MIEAFGDQPLGDQASELGIVQRSDSKSTVCVCAQAAVGAIAAAITAAAYRAVLLHVVFTACSFPALRGLSNTLPCIRESGKAGYRFICGF